MRLHGLLLVLGIALLASGCSKAEAGATTRAQREARLLREEVDRLRTQVRALEEQNATLIDQVKGLRETSYVRTSPEGFALRLNFGAAAVLIVALASIAAVRITRLRVERSSGGSHPTPTDIGDDPASS